MLATTETALERLVTLADENENLTGAQVLDLWAKERAKERHRRAAERQERADEAVYFLARMEETPVYFEAIGESLPRDRKVEKLSIRKKDLPRFAKERGIEYASLMDVLELRRKEVVDTWGKRWQQDHPRGMYIDNSERDKDRAEDIAEDKKQAEALAKRAASRAATSQPVVTKEYR